MAHTENGITWPTTPDGGETPTHRKSWKTLTEGKPVYCCSDYRVTSVGEEVGHWMCGFCRKISTDRKSPYQYETLALCVHCRSTNRISRG